MTFEEYQKQAITTLLGDHAYGDISAGLAAQILGLVEESGEVAGKFKKLIRDKHGIITPEDKEIISKELGDVLWYVSSIAHLLDLDMNTIAQGNLDKLFSRKARGVIKGSGDNR